MRSGRGVSAFPVGLLGEPLPGLRHLLHDFAMSLGPGLASQALAFLRKSPVFRCCFHAGITGRSTGPFRMHGGHASGTRTSSTNVTGPVFGQRISRASRDALDCTFGGCRG